MRWLLTIALLYGCFAQPAEAVAEVDFASQIQPILARNCYACHGPDQQEGSIRFDQLETLLAAADSGELPIVPKDSQASEIIARITANDESLRMPPEGMPLKESEISLLRDWIDQGAEFTKHWAFQPMTSQIAPVVDAHDQAHQPLDLFVFQKLERAGIQWVDQAPPEVLIRRVYLDTLGLPPSPEEVERWTGNWQHDSYDRLVDHVLSTPSFGERWARMWLDVVRYAESNSFERDNPKPNAWRFRDYVIQSFNDDKPYDQFVREQIAGDELDEVTLDTLIATGFYRLGIWDDEPADPLQAIFDEYDDIVSTTSQAFLGLTFGCARCHDHKIDPITQRDYYSMLAFVRDVTPYATRSDQVTNNQLDLDPELAKLHRTTDSEIRRLRRQLDKLEQTAIEKMSATDQRATEGDQREKVLQEKLSQYMDAETWQEYSEEKQKLEAATAEKRAMPERVTTLGLARLDPKPPETFVLLRGSPHSPAEPVELTFPELLGGGVPEFSQAASQVGDTAQSAGRRRLLADWIASSDNWLTARVIVNRIWLHYFGRGIVRSPNNFGLMGDPPTHPELLDYLATDLVNNGWSLKQIHRQILLSATYRRGSTNLADSAARDPENNLFWRQNLRRLSAEQVRDSILLVTGQINLAKSGPPMYPDLSAEVLASQSQPGKDWEKSPLSEQARRSVYIHVKRSLPVPMLSVFDFPDMDLSCEARFLTTQPAQALTMLNSRWMQEQAKALLERVQREVGDDLRSQAVRCLELAYCMTDIETGDHRLDVDNLLELVQRLRHDQGLSDLAARQSMCLVVLNLNHFIYLD